jgi:hypothetical protein
MDFQSEHIIGKIFFSDDLKQCIIRAKVDENVKNNQISYIAANPPDHRASYYGSGHPFPNTLVAFEGTQSKGILRLSSTNQYEVMITVPNAYYIGLGSKIVSPTIYFSYNNGFVDKKANVVIKNNILFRSLTYPQDRFGPEFYESFDTLPVRSQENILRDSTINVDGSFWSLRPPV